MRYLIEFGVIRLFSCLTEIRSRIRSLLQGQDTVLVAIEGCCTAGKTTLAGLLAEEFDCNIFHMDDFFLQDHQRTPERFSQAGGNVDYERFFQEVLLPLKAGEAVHLRPFDCRTRQLGEPVDMPVKGLNIIDGTYSCHPLFGTPYDLTVFLRVSPELQRQRILRRPEFLHRSFFESWIPMEQTYFDTFSIEESCDIRCGGQEAL